MLFEEVHVQIARDFDPILVHRDGQVVAPPPGADVTTLEGLKASMHLFEPKHFLFPFLAHALGAFTGAFLAAFVAASHKVAMALVIGVVSLAGGVANAFMLPSPAWFNALDLVGAYLPMAWIGGKIAKSIP